MRELQRLMSEFVGEYRNCRKRNQDSNVSSVREKRCVEERSQRCVREEKKVPLPQRMRIKKRGRIEYLKKA